ncbi:MAG: FAD-binding oxidoreductase [Planctomycetes bacterium]|nr:FAD-binding oxidoreductase [Planctomycetota bacterium]
MLLDPRTLRQAAPAATAHRDGGRELPVEPQARGTIPPDPVGPDSLVGIPRVQTNPSRWNGASWDAFVSDLARAGVDVREEKGTRAAFVTDAGGLAFGMPHGVVTARSAEQVAAVLSAAQARRVPVTTRGGGLTTEGESVAFGGLQLDMTGMSRMVWVDREKMLARVQGGMFWHDMAEVLRRQGLDYISAPLNFTSSVGGTLAVGGIDVNACRHGCSADQCVAMEVVTPTGQIVECSEDRNPELFERVLLGYGQFGVVTEATMRVRPYTPCRMHYLFYDDLRTAMEDLIVVVRSDATDYSGILTMKDRANNLLFAFDSEEREKDFFANVRPKLRGLTEMQFAVRAAGFYALRPWRIEEALWLYRRKKLLLPEFERPEHLRDGKMFDRTVVFSRAVWRHWGNRTMVIPDLATSEEKFIEAILRGNRVMRKYFAHYTLYCVAIRLSGNRPRYEMSCIPPDARDWAYGCEFEPMFEPGEYSRDHLQSFKNAIYDVGVEMRTSYYRFGGSMKGYIRRVFGDAVVDRQLEFKRQADPAMILNPDVVF